MKVCWLSNYFSPYKLKLFDELSKNIELTLLMLGGKDANRNDEWKQNDNVSYKVIYIDSSFNKTIDDLAKENDVLVDSLYFSIYGYKAVSAFKKNNKKTILHADGGIAKNRGFILNGLMTYLMKRHDSVLSSSKYVDDYFEYYGVEKDKLNHYRFTSLTKEDLNNNKNLIQNKDDYRKQFNIDNKYTFISVGQPIRRKGFDILLESYIKSGLQDKCNLLIVGGKPQEKIKEIVEINKLNNVRFVDLISSEELKKYYALSDAFMLTTREDIWGLVIEEAMSFGLPVITSNNCVAGLHFSDISKSVLINEVNDIDGYAKKMNSLYTNSVNNDSLQVIEDYSIENSAKDIIKIIESVLN